MNKEFITQSASTLSVKEFYFVLLASSAKSNEDLHTKLDKYKESEAVREQLDLAQEIVELSCLQGFYLKLVEIFIDVLDSDGEAEDPSDKQFSEWLPTSGLEAKINILIELIPE